MSLAELICPAAPPAALRTAVEAGADAVYCGFQNATNAHNFPGLNFTPDELAEAVAQTHRDATKVLLALNTYPTICKGRQTAPSQPGGYDAFEEPVSLNLSRLLPELFDAGVNAFKIEGRQRSKSYVRNGVRAFRLAVDKIRAGKQAGYRRIAKAAPC